MICAKCGAVMVPDEHGPIVALRRHWAFAHGGVPRSRSYRTSVTPRY